MTKTNEQTNAARDAGQDELICGKQIQSDRSGVGHCWQNISASEINADAREEIAAEIIDGKRDECDDYIASNGRHYRW